LSYGRIKWLRPKQPLLNIALRT